VAESEDTLGRSSGTGVSVQALRADAQELSPRDFEERHGSAFLLLSAADLRKPTGPSATEVQVLGVDEEGSERTAGLALLAYPVRRTERSVGHLVTVGRASNNDVVVRDVSISRFHAFLKEEDDGKFRLQDANSTNGTIVNGASVPAQGNGPPVDLKTGDTLRLGQVEFTFLDSNALREFVLAIEG
jgi:pSer/pThr/pTyr-binding forkhead associated (FHA) protein